jgi:hypothetical protein
MKTCAQCSRRYQNSLAFCPVDGSVLSSSSLDVDASDTLHTADTLNAKPVAGPGTEDPSIAERTPTEPVAHPEASEQYTVFVDDNFHYMDKAERRVAGVFSDCETAVARCRQMVERCLSEQYEEGMSEEQLLSQYKSFGEDPWISSADGNCKFSAWTYAAQRCGEICSGKS